MPLDEYEVICALFSCTLKIKENYKIKVVGRHLQVALQRDSQVTLKIELYTG